MLWVVSPMVLKTANMPTATIASATTTSTRVKPRSRSIGGITLDLDGAVGAADQGDAPSCIRTYQRQPIRGHVTAAVGDELRQQRFRLRRAAQQYRPAFDEEFEREAWRQLAVTQPGIVLDIQPALLESVESQELIATGLDAQSVIAAFELSLFLQQGDRVGQALGFALQLAVFAKHSDRNGRNGRKYPDD